MSAPDAEGPRRVHPLHPEWCMQNCGCVKTAGHGGKCDLTGPLPSAGCQCLSCEPERASAGSGATHAVTEYGTTNCPVEGVRANVDDGECSACGARVAGSGASPARDGDTRLVGASNDPNLAVPWLSELLAEVERLRVENERISGAWAEVIQREQRADNEWRHDLGVLTDERDTARSALAEVAARHQPYPLDDRALCRHCGREWPCADAVTAGETG